MDEPVAPLLDAVDRQVQPTAPLLERRRHRAALGGVERLDDDRVRRRLGFGPEPPAGREPAVEPERTDVGERLERRVEARRRQLDGEDAVRDLAQLLGRRERAAERLAQRRSGAPVPARLRELVERDAEVVAEREHPLLRRVVEVALHAPARGVRGRDDACSRCRRVGEADERLGAQPLVSEREPRRRPERALERLGARRVGLDERDDACIADDRRHPPSPAEHDRPPVGVDDAAGGADRVAEPQVGVAEGTREQRPEPRPVRQAPEGDGEPRHARAHEPRAHREPREADPERDEGSRPGHEERGVQLPRRRLPGRREQRGRVRCERDAHGRRRRERRPRCAAGQRRRRGEPEDGDERRGRARREREQEHERRQPPRELGVVANDEGVDGAVAPAVRVAQRVADESQRDRARRRRERGAGDESEQSAVHGPARPRRHLRREREHDDGSQRSDGGRDRTRRLRPALPARPHGREPGDRQRHGERAGGRERALGQEQQRCRDDRRSREHLQERERGRRAGVCRVVRHGARGPAADDAGRQDEHDEAERAQRRPHSAALTGEPPVGVRARDPCWRR